MLAVQVTRRAKPEDPATEEGVGIDSDGAATPPDPAAPRKLDLFGDDLCSGRKAVTKAMTGAPEHQLQRSFQSGNDVVIAEGWTNFILGCTESIDGKKPTKDLVLDLDESDRSMLLLRIGRRTFAERRSLDGDPVSGDRIEFAWRCAPPYVRQLGCGHEANFKAVDMGDLTWLPVPDPAPIKLSGERIFTYGRSTGRASLSYVRLRQGKERVDWPKMIQARGGSIDGKPWKESHYYSLTGEDIAAVKRALRHNGGPQSIVESECGGCRVLWKSPLEVLPGFFFPAEAEE